MTTQGPAPRPCSTCPYRRDVPAGIWAASEYDKLPAYDAETPYQPTALFQCHQYAKGDEDARLCAGWVGCHGEGLLALRLAVIRGRVDPAVFEYSTPTPLFESGAQAAAHGKAGIAQPSATAQRAAAKLASQRAERLER